jgi:predicted PurR-regulated permease PerM
MTPATDPIPPPARQRLAWALVHLTLIAVTGLCLRPVSAGLAWAAVLAMATWPVYQRLRRHLGGHPTLSALAMTGLVTLLVAVPLALAARLLALELGPALRTAGRWLATTPAPPAWMTSLPLLLELWAQIQAAVTDGDVQAGDWLQPLLAPGGRALGALARTIGQTVLAVLTLFFLYRNGDRYQQQIATTARYWLGERAQAVFGPIRGALQAVFVGVILAAAAQGLVAMLGYLAVGVEAPVVLGVLTALLAILPFAAVLVWGTVGVGLIAAGSWAQGIGLLIWGMVAVSSVDNLVRASILSNTARLPYLQSLIALIGGLAVFGPLGLFIGPALLAVWMGLWQEWAPAATAAPPEASPPESA